jgi:glutamate dehydrogenase/leucine dehydrogenase
VTNDVYSPCATGGVLSAQSIPRLRCRIVAGAANNQLAEPADADGIAEAGILYAPDFVINAGGALHLLGLEVLGWNAHELAGKLAGVGSTLTEIYRQTERDGGHTEAAAEAIAAGRLRAARRR